MRFSRHPYSSASMSTNRPFFANILAAFRAHSAIQQASSASASTASTASAQVAHAATASTVGRSTTITPSSARSIVTKAGQTSGSTAAAVQAASHIHQSARQQSTSPLSRSPGSPRGNHFGTSSAAQRRDSSSSTEGFRDALGTEKWYIGGRNAAGEERFYRLGMARRHRSIDRLSLDRLSL